VVRTDGNHAPLDATQDRRPLVAGEVDAAPLAQLIQERAQHALVIGTRRLVGSGDELLEQRPDRLDVGDDVDDRGR
jgi:hypothetical protein